MILRLIQRLFGWLPEQLEADYFNMSHNWPICTNYGKRWRTRRVPKALRTRSPETGLPNWAIPDCECHRQVTEKDKSA